MSRRIGVEREDVFCVRLPLLDVREQGSIHPGDFRMFDLYLTDAQAECLILLAKDLEEERVSLRTLSDAESAR